MFGKSAKITIMVWLIWAIAVHISDQTETFEMDCNILTTLETLQTRLEQQESRLQLQDNRLRNQEMEIASLKQRLGSNEEPIALKDCGEIFTNGTTTSGVYIISPDGRCPFSVYCDMTDDGWTVIQLRIDGAVNFRRTWDEYVQGFGEVDGEYWLGLEKIHRLTKDGYEIYFDIENYDGTRDHAHYKVFVVHGSSSLYTMNVDTFGYEGTLNELLSYHNGQMFSTYDRDNDAGSSNCADVNGGGGWWYTNCFRLGNPNGVFGKKAKGGVGYWVVGNVFVRTFSIKVRQREHQCAARPLI